MTPRLVAIINFYKLKSTPLCSYKQNLLSQYMYFPNCWALYWPNHIIKMWSLTSLTFFCAGQFSLTLFFDFVLQSVSLIIFTSGSRRVLYVPFLSRSRNSNPRCCDCSQVCYQNVTHIQNELHKSLMSFTHPHTLHVLHYIPIPNTCYITSPLGCSDFEK